MKATLFRELSDTSEIIDIQEGVSLEANFPDIDFDKRIVLVNGKESDKNHIVERDDIIAIRSVPGYVPGLTEFVIIASILILTPLAIRFGKMLYDLYQQRSDQEELMKSLKEDVKSVPYLKGGYNNVATGKTQPYIIGEHLFTPFLLAPAFSKIAGVDGRDQYFHAVLENGFNNQVIRKLYCDDVSLKDWGDALTVPQEGVFTFDETSPFYDASSLIEVAQDGNDFTTAILNKKIVSEQSGAQLLKSDNADYEDLLYTLQPKTRAVEIVIMINGLRQYGSDGSKNNRTIEVIPEYQLTDGGAWTAFTFDQNGTPSNTFTRNKMEQMRFCARKDFTYAQVKDLTAPVKVRLRCTTPAYDGSAHDQVYCQWVQSEIYDPIASATAGDFVDEKIIGDNERAMSTLIGLKIKASASNQDKLSKINCITSGVARTWNGTAWSAGKTPTRNPAAWLLETLTSPTHLASQVDDTEIDLDSFGELYEKCAADSLAVDMVLVDGDTKESVLASILETCFSVLYRDIYGNITVAIDTAKTNAIALLNTQNVISFSNEKSLARRTDGIKITYTSRDAGYAQSSYIVMRDGVTRDSDSIIRDINVTGITEYNHIVKYARRIMAIESLRPKSVTVEVGKEGTYFTPLSKVLVQHPSLKIGLGSAEIKSVITNATHITGLELYEPVEYDAGVADGYGVVIACVGDDYYTPLAAAYTADSARDTEITFVTPILKGAAVIPHAGDVLSYGLLNAGDFGFVTSPMMIVGIEPSDKGFTLTLADYDEAIYTVGAIPEYEPNFLGKKATVSVQVPGAANPPTLDEVQEVKAIAVGAQEGVYRGRYLDAHPEAYNPMDSWTVYHDGTGSITRGVYYSAAGVPTRITTSSDMELQAKLINALGDIAWCEANDFGVSADYGIESIFQSIGVVSALIDTLIANNAFIQNLATGATFTNYLFAQNIEVGAGGAIYYFADSGANRRAIKIADNAIEWGNFPEGGTFDRVGGITRTDTSNSVVIDGNFTAAVSSGGGEPVKRTINSAGSSFPSLIRQSDGQFRVAYRRNSDGYLVQRVTVGGAWQAETVINPASSFYPSLIQQADGQFRVVYQRPADGYLVQRVTVAGVWQDATVISPVSSYYTSLIQQADGQYRVVYQRSDGYLAQRVTSGGVWQAETIINAASISTPSLIQQADGQYRVVYKRNGSGGYLVQRVTVAGVWQAETIINAASSLYPSLIQQSDGQFRVMYHRESDGYLVQRVTVAGVWQAETIINAANSYFPSLIKTTGGSFAYRVAFVEANLLKQIDFGASPPMQCRIGAGIIESGVAPDGSRWQKTSDGMLECWGVAYTTTTGVLTITYPSEFDASDLANISVQCTIHNHQGGVTFHLTVGDNADSGVAHTTTTQYTATRVRADGWGNTAVTTRVSWRAKGLAKV